MNKPRIFKENGRWNLLYHGSLSLFDAWKDALDMLFHYEGLHKSASRRNEWVRIRRY
jgi:hypothetical protein